MATITMIDWSQIDTVLLDMDGTLLDLHFDNYFWLQYVPARYGHKHGLDVEQARATLLPLMEAEKGSLNWYCLDFWSQKIGLDIPALKAELKHMISIRPHVVEFLSHLKDTNKHIMLVTNAHRDSLELKMATTGLATWFDQILVSHDFGVAKEHPDFWRRLKLKHHFNSERTLLVDDTESVLESAHKAGIKHLLTLLRPDSKQTKRLHAQFPAIEHFDEILPTYTAGARV